MSALTDALKSVPGPVSPMAAPTGASPLMAAVNGLDTGGSTPESQNDPATDHPDNPISYIFGTAKHLVTGIPQIIGGLGSVIRMTAEDAIGAVRQGMESTFNTGGEKSQWYQNIEQNGYNWGNMARAMPHVIAQDYAARYGGHGMDEMLDQVYTNPLSYVMDIVSVGDIAAKGAELAGKAGLLSDAAVQAVRGVSPLQAAVGKTLGAERPLTGVGILQGGAGTSPGVSAFGSEIADLSKGITGISTSVNPIKRVIQNSILKRVLTRSAEDTQALLDSGQYARLGLGSEPSAGLIQQAGEATANAAQEGLRVLRPQAEKFVTTRAARYIAGLTKQNFYAARNQMVGELKQFLPQGKNITLVKDIQGTNGWLEAMLSGETMPATGLPSSAPLEVDQRGISELAQTSDGYLLDSQGMPIQVGAGDPTARRQIAEAVQEHFGGYHGGPRKATGQAPTITYQTYNTPVSREGKDAMRYTALVADIKDAPGSALEIANKNGWQILGVDNQLNKPSAWNGLDYYFQTPQGVAQINIATPELQRAQRIVSDINATLDKWGGTYAAMEREQAAILQQLGVGDLEGVDVSALSVDEQAMVGRYQEIEKLLPNIQEEIDAASRTAARVWDHPMRELNGSYAEFPENMKIVDQAYNWSQKWHMGQMVKRWNPEWANLGIKGPYTVAMERAFMPMKVNILQDMAVHIRADVQGIIERAQAAGRNTENTLLEVEDYLRTIHQIPAETVRKALLTNEDADVAKAMYAAYKTGTGVQSPDTLLRIREIASNPELAGAEDFTRTALKDPARGAQLITNRLVNELRMPILRGQLEGPLKDAWGWQNFADSVPQLPGYYPHIRSANPSSMFFKGARLTAPDVAFKSGFKGYLMESGRVLEDPFRAYATRAYQMLRHEELIDQLEQLRPLARELSTGELAEWKSGAMGKGDEVLFSPDYLKNKVSIHSELLDEIHGAMFDNPDLLYEDAARQALNNLNEKLQTTTLADLEGSKVYALPRHVADQFQSGFLSGFAPSRMRMFWDKPRDLWMSSVLGLNPRWFLYRMMGNIIFTGISDPAALRYIFGWTSRKNNDLIEMMLADAETQGGSVLSQLSRGYVSAESQRLGTVPGLGGKIREWGSSADEFPVMTRRLDRIYNSRAGQFLARRSQATTSWVNYMEQAERRAIAVSSYAKMTGKRFESSLNLWRDAADKGFDQGTVDRMMADANWTLGNYTSLSPLERDVVRRYLMPFYPFYRHMLKFATRMPWDNPLKSNVLRLINEADQDIGPHLPGYMMSAVNISGIAGNALPPYWNITHWNPLAELALPESTPFNFVDPRIRMLIQAWTGTDQFNMPYQSQDVYEAPNGVKMIRTGTGWEPFEGIQHPTWLTMLEAMYGGPGSQVINPYKFNMPLSKTIAANLGFSLSNYDPVAARIREMEARQAAMSSSSARDVPRYTG